MHIEVERSGKSWMSPNESVPVSGEGRLDRVAQGLVHAVLAAVNARASGIFRWDADRGAMVPLALAAPTSSRVTDDAADDVLTALREVAFRCVSSVVEDPTAAGMVRSLRPGAAVVAVPLRGTRIVGVLGVADQPRRIYPPDQIALITTFAELAAMALENEKLLGDLSGLEASQRRMVESERLHAVGEHAAGVAHHLNNIMTVIVGNVQLVLRHSQAPEDSAGLQAVERAALEGAELVRRLGSFSRTQADREHEILDLNELVADVVALSRARWQDEAQVQGIGIDARIERGVIPMVSGDAIGLREVLLNIVVNAIDALPHGGHIVLRTWGDDRSVYCSVSDDGVGMSSEVRERVIEPFFTTKGPNSRGLGLSAAYGTLQQHRGTLVIDSVEGRGTTVTFSLPQGPRAAPPTAAAEPTKQDLRILMIDDDAPVRASLSRLLADDGHVVVEAGSGEEALHRLETGEKFEIVFTDLGMPRMNGWELTHRIKTLRPSLHVVLMTGWGERPKGARTDWLAPDMILAKPITEDTLRETLAAAKNGRQEAS